MFSRILKSNLLVNLSIKTCGSEILLLSEFINIVSIAYIWMDLIKLLYTSLVLGPPKSLKRIEEVGPLKS